MEENNNENNQVNSQKENQENTGKKSIKAKVILIIIAIIIYTIIVVQITLNITGRLSDDTDTSKEIESNNQITIDESIESQSDSGLNISEQEEEEQEVQIKLKNKVTKDSEYEMTVVDYDFSKKVLPPNTSSFYTYYEAKEDGHQYLDIQINYKNLDYTDIDADEVGSVKIKFDDKYEYTGFSVIEDSDGDFTYTNITSIAPLTVGKLHYLIEVPDEVANGDESVVAYINIGSDKYELKIR